MAGLKRTLLYSFSLRSRQVGTAGTTKWKIKATLNTQMIVSPLQACSDRVALIISTAPPRSQVKGGNHMCSTPTDHVCAEKQFHKFYIQSFFNNNG